MARFDRVIPPGGKGAVVIKINTRGYQGKIHKTAAVYLNDPGQSRVVLTITADIKVPILVKPRGVMLSGFEGDEIVQKVTIQAEEDKPLKLKISRISSPDKLACKLKTIEKGRIFELVLQNKVRKRGKYSGNVMLETNYPRKPSVFIPFLGVVRGNLELHPGRINFFIHNSEKSNQNNIYYRRSVMLAIHKGNTLKINRVEVNQDLFETRIKEFKAGRKYAVEVKLILKKIGDRVLKETMKIYTNQKDEPVVTVPIRIQKARAENSGHHSVRRHSVRHHSVKNLKE